MHLWEFGARKETVWIYPGSRICLPAILPSYNCACLFFMGGKRQLKSSITLSLIVKSGLQDKMISFLALQKSTQNPN